MADVAGRARLLIRDAVNVVRTAASGAPHRQATARPIRGCGDHEGGVIPSACGEHAAVMADNQRSRSAGTDIDT
jgi:hypothetical protein